jgi:hypothetical protein
MGATSVTGVGLGSADGSNKGSAHMTLGASHLVGPRVVACDTGTLDGSGNLVVHLPVLNGPTNDFVVIAGDTGASAAAVAAAFAMDSTKTTLTFKGTASHTIAYSVIKKGLAV